MGANKVKRFRVQCSLCGCANRGEEGRPGLVGPGGEVGALWKWEPEWRGAGADHASKEPF